MDFASTQIAKDKSRWKGSVAKSSVVPHYLRKLWCSLYKNIHITNFSELTSMMFSLVWAQISPLQKIPVMWMMGWLVLEFSPFSLEECMCQQGVVVEVDISQISQQQLLTPVYKVRWSAVYLRGLLYQCVPENFKKKYTHKLNLLVDKGAQL